MSEIKGQILGIVLVLAIFGAIAGVMVSIFRQTADKVEDQLSNEVAGVEIAKTVSIAAGDLIFK